MKKKIEELLETIWTLQEKGKVNRTDILANTLEKGVAAALNEMEQQKLLIRHKDEFRLSEKGHQRAAELIRRHRLAERLLVDLFQLNPDQMEHMACEFEHILDPAVTDSVCTFLGHPPTCPHGRAIPRGECCRTFRRQVKPLVSPLTDLDMGDTATIVYITTRHHTRLDRLSALGVLPGNHLKLHQKKPAIIIQIDETNIALEASIAEEIYVKRTG